MSAAPERRIILVAGPSGSGKSRLSRELGLPKLRLDDFYRADDEPGLPRLTSVGDDSVIDWDHPATWNCDAAVVALTSILETGRATVPDYVLSLNRAVGTYEFDLGDARAVICEGIFAPELLGPLRRAGVPVEAIWLDRPALLNFVRRLVRDLAERRKAPMVLVRRGLGLLRDEPRLRRVAVERGFRPLGMRASLRRIRTLTAKEPT